MASVPGWSTARRRAKIPAVARDLAKREARAAGSARAAGKAGSASARAAEARKPGSSDATALGAAHVQRGD